MDYGAILKRSWEIVWRHKILWLFGFFAGSGGFNGNFNYNSSSGDFGRGDSSRYADMLKRWAEANLGLLIAIGLMLFVIAVILWVLSIAARGGLVYLVNEGDEGRPVKAGPGWQRGFRYWGRTFLIGFVLSLPVVVVIALVAVLVILAVVGSGGDPGAAAAAALFGVCGLLIVIVFVLLPYAIVAGVLNELGLRYAVLSDMPAIQSIGRAWADVRGRFGQVAIMWLLTVAVAIAVAIPLAIIAVLFILPAIASFAVGAYVPGALLIVLAVVVLAVASAPFSAYHSALWTLFYRRLHGLGAPVVAQPYMPAPQGYMPPPPPSYAVPQPPAPPAPQPPAPPASPAPQPPIPQPPAPPAPPAPQPPASEPPAPPNQPG